MRPDKNYSLLELILALADAMDLVSHKLTDHHKRVAYIASALARQMGLSDSQVFTLTAAGLLHDIGALSLSERLDESLFKTNPSASESLDHAYMGYVLLRRFEVFSELAPLVRYHHLWWERREDICPDEEQALLANLLHLADRVEVLGARHDEPLGHVDDISEQIRQQSGRMFAPDLVSAFEALAKQESFWLDIHSQYLSFLLTRIFQGWFQPLTFDGLLSVSRVFSTVIDYRSRFTATHSVGVAASAEAIGKVCGFDPTECRSMRLAGNLHDLGKLTVPAEILEKPGKLTPGEFAVLRSHTYHTYRVLERISGLETINEWASFHHERLDGGGYPFHLNEGCLSLGSRIMAVADVFTAISEDRPYRAGMEPDQVVKVLTDMANGSALDRSVVAMLKDAFDSINQARISAQAEALDEFDSYAEQTAESMVL